MTRLFLLSPANCGGTRARQLLSDRASFDLALRLRTGGAPLGDVFTFMSGLYFRGKLTYALRFASRGEADPAIVERGVFIITPGAGLRTPETLVTRAAIQRFARIDVAVDEPKYRRPLEAAASMLANAVPEAEFVLLGSVATPKYVDVLSGILGQRLLFPSAFVGRGDMSRGGLLLRHAASGAELEYVPVVGAVRHGPRPPKLAPLGRSVRWGE
ncbi:MAG TPA: hypothetical protein VNK41_01515, partial [Vicinamibacterales bacterium]|nr:hypothetical protein [Vicinamibacterales bacterium]